MIHRTANYGCAYTQRFFLVLWFSLFPTLACRNIEKVYFALHNALATKSSNFRTRSSSRTDESMLHFAMTDARRREPYIYYICSRRRVLAVSLMATIDEWIILLNE